MGGNRRRLFLMDVRYDGESVILYLHDPAKELEEKDLPNGGSAGRVQPLRIPNFETYFYHFDEELEGVKEKEFTPSNLGKNTLLRYDSVSHSMYPVKRTSARSLDMLRTKSDRIIEDKWDHTFDMQSYFLWDLGLRPGTFIELDEDGSLDLAASACVPGSRDLSYRDVDIQERGDLYDKASTLMLDQDIPNIRRLAIDIEVEPNIKGTLPEPGETRITTIGLAGSDGIRRVLTLSNTNGNDPNIITFNGDELSMIQTAFELFNDYPIVLSYNGDDFDLPFMYARLAKLSGSHKTTRNTQKYVHIDLYKVFSNRALHLYAFGQKYVSFGLDAVCKAMLGRGKSGDYEKGADEQVMQDKKSDEYLLSMAKYCLNDADITLELTTYDDAVVMNLLWFLCRITSMPVGDVSRTAVSQWSQSMLYAYMRACGILVPNRQDINSKTTGLAKPTELDNTITKKYKGAIVFEPLPGVHFDIAVVDFASLYPSIVKTYNVSYDTIRCPHKECESNKIPQTSHWYCGKRTGILSGQIGRLRDLRVNKYKPSKEPIHQVLAACLKVFLNASYGVLGFEQFELYSLPAAEAVTAMGRHIINQTSKQCDKINLMYIYGDTDSLFVKNYPDKIKRLIEYTDKEHDVTLEHEKTYKFVMFSNLKKNYFGVRDNGQVDIKGMSAKKSNAPKIIREAFQEIIHIFTTKINSHDDIKDVMDDVSCVIRKALKKVDEMASLWKSPHIKDKQKVIDELAVTMQCSKEKYGSKGKPEHIRACEQSGRSPSKGERITFLKCIDGPVLIKVDRGASGDDFERDFKEDMLHSSIDVKKYHNLVMSATGQIANMIGVNKERINGQQILF